MLYADQEDLEQVPAWSGIFFEFEGEGRGMMCISNNDERYHRTPAGWQPAGFKTSTFGEFEVYTYIRRIEGYAFVDPFSSLKTEVS